MKSNTITTVGLTVGAVALVGGAFWALQKKPGARPAALPNPQIQTPGIPTGYNPSPQAVGPSNADVLAAIQQQQSAAAEAQKQADIRGFIDRIGATENQEILLLTQIDAVNANNAALQDFIQRAYDELMNNSPQYLAAVQECKATVERNCGGYWWLNQCWKDNMWQCENKSIDYSWGNPPASMMNLAKSTLGPQRLDVWKADQRRPLEAKLVYYEVQYKGMVQELKNRYGVDYNPSMGADYIKAVKAHSAAQSAIARGVQPAA